MRPGGRARRASASRGLMETMTFVKTSERYVLNMLAVVKCEVSVCAFVERRF